MKHEHKHQSWHHRHELREHIWSLTFMSMCTVWTMAWTMSTGVCNEYVYKYKYKYEQCSLSISLKTWRSWSAFSEHQIRLNSKWISFVIRQDRSSSQSAINSSFHLWQNSISISFVIRQELFTLRCAAQDIHKVYTCPHKVDVLTRHIHVLTKHHYRH